MWKLLATSMALGLWCHPNKLRYFQQLFLPQRGHHPMAHQCIGSYTSTQTPPILACAPKSGCICGVPSAPARGDWCTAAPATAAQLSSHPPSSACEAVACQGEWDGGVSSAFLCYSSLPSCLDLLALPSPPPLLHLLIRHEQATPKLTAPLSLQFSALFISHTILHHFHG